MFGTDRDTGAILPLSVGINVYRKVKGQEVERYHEALVRHVCQVVPNHTPVPDRDFSEPQGAD